MYPSFEKRLDAIRKLVISYQIASMSGKDSLSTLNDEIEFERKSLLMEIGAYDPAESFFPSFAMLIQLRKLVTDFLATEGSKKKFSASTLLGQIPSLDVSTHLEPAPSNILVSIDKSTNMSQSSSAGDITRSSSVNKSLRILPETNGEKDLMIELKQYATPRSRQLLDSVKNVYVDVVTNQNTTLNITDIAEAVNKNDADECTISPREETYNSIDYGKSKIASSLQHINTDAEDGKRRLNTTTSEDFYAGSSLTNSHLVRMSTQLGEDEKVNAHAPPRHLEKSERDELVLRLLREREDEIRFIEEAKCAPFPPEPIIHVPPETPPSQVKSVQRLIHSSIKAAESVSSLPNYDDFVVEKEKKSRDPSSPVSLMRGDLVENSRPSHEVEKGASTVSEKGKEKLRDNSDISSTSGWIDFPISHLRFSRSGCQAGINSESSVELFSSSYNNERAESIDSSIVPPGVKSNIASLCEDIDTVTLTSGRIVSIRRKVPVQPLISAVSVHSQMKHSISDSVAPSIASDEANISNQRGLKKEIISQQKNEPPFSLRSNQWLRSGAPPHPVFPNAHVDTGLGREIDDHSASSSNNVFYTSPYKQEQDEHSAAENRSSSVGASSASPPLDENQELSKTYLLSPDTPNDIGFRRFEEHSDDNEGVKPAPKEDFLSRIEEVTRRIDYQDKSVPPTSTPHLNNESTNRKSLSKIDGRESEISPSSTLFSPPVWDDSPDIISPESKLGSERDKGGNYEGARIRNDRIASSDFEEGAMAAQESSAEEYASADHSPDSHASIMAFIRRKFRSESASIRSSDSAVGALRESLQQSLRAAHARQSVSSSYSHTSGSVSSSSPLSPLSPYWSRSESRPSTLEQAIMQEAERSSRQKARAAHQAELRNRSYAQRTSKQALEQQEKRAHSQNRVSAFRRSLADMQQAARVRQNARNSSSLESREFHDFPDDLSDHRSSRSRVPETHHHKQQQFSHPVSQSRPNSQLRSRSNSRLGSDGGRAVSQPRSNSLTSKSRAVVGVSTARSSAESWAHSQDLLRNRRSGAEDDLFDVAYETAGSAVSELDGVKRAQQRVLEARKRQEREEMERRKEEQRRNEEKWRQRDAKIAAFLARQKGYSSDVDILGNAAPGSKSSSIKSNDHNRVDAGSAESGGNLLSTRIPQPITVESHSVPHEVLSVLKQASSVVRSARLDNDAIGRERTRATDKGANYTQNRAATNNSHENHSDQDRFRGEVGMLPRDDKVAKDVVAMSKTPTEASTPRDTPSSAVSAGTESGSESRTKTKFKGSPPLHPPTERLRQTIITPEKEGSIGKTSSSASIAPTVQSPTAFKINFDEIPVVRTPRSSTSGEREEGSATTRGVSGVRVNATPVDILNSIEGMNAKLKSALKTTTSLQEKPILFSPPRTLEPKIQLHKVPNRAPPPISGSLSLHVSGPDVNSSEPCAAGVVLNETPILPDSSMTSGVSNICVSADVNDAFEEGVPLNSNYRDFEEMSVDSIHEGRTNKYETIVSTTNVERPMYFERDEEDNHSVSSISSSLSRSKSVSSDVEHVQQFLSRLTAFRSARR